MNGRRIVGIEIKICALLQIFLPIFDNRELLTHVIATKYDTDKRYVYDNLVQRAKSARQITVCIHTLKQILTLLIITTSTHFVLAYIAVQYATCLYIIEIIDMSIISMLYMRVLNSCTNTVFSLDNTVVETSQI